MNEKEFNRLLTAYLDGELSTEEIIQLKDAVEQTPSYRHQFQDEVRLHTLLREVVSEKIEEKKISNSSKKVFKKVPKPKPILAYVFSAVASVAVIAFSLGYYITHFSPKSVGVCVQIPGEGTHQVVRKGKTVSLQKSMELFEDDKILSSGFGGTMISLNDGSMVSLEKDTSLQLFDEKDTQISISRGEILLEVSKRKVGNTPFRIKTQDSTLTVLGTIFSVAAGNNGFTKLSVYEGRVELLRLKDSKTVQVNASQFVSTENLSLQTIPMHEDAAEAQPEIVNLLPTDDVYMDGRKVQNNEFLKASKGQRTIYLKFKLEGIGPVKKAVLYMKQEEDPGSGTLYFHLADKNSWNEKSIRYESVPKPKTLLARHTGSVAGGETIEVDLIQGIKGDGVYTVIVTLSKGDAFDIWFSSKEGRTPPVLQLTR